MLQQFEKLKSARKFLITLIEDLNIEQLNQVPTGFSNNIIWNLAHLVAVQQALCYKRSGLQPTILDKYYTPFLPNTKPEGFVDEADLEIIKTLLISTLDEFETDYKKSFFTNYTPFVTRYGAALDTIDDALLFLPFHEGLHFGTILALKKLVKL
jgi:hypothetical protein